MKVKKYIAPTMPEVMKKIRHDLGKDAVILNSKEIRTGGFLGFFTKPSLEVVAALDPDPVYSEIVKEPRVNLTPAPPRSEATEQFERKSKDNLSKHKMIPIEREKSTEPIELPESLAKVMHHMEIQGVGNELRTLLSKRLLKKWYREDSEEKANESIDRWLKEELLNILSKVSFGGFKYDKKFLNLIGPTGVGKTTTIAKIAADAVLNKKKKVAMITTDTYRIAAIDQLKTYAEILNVPLEVAYNHEDFERAQQKFNDYDVIFVDSAGRNYKNTQYVNDLEEIFQFNDEMENYLVLSLTSKFSDMKRIVNQFENVPINQLILTKKDETDTFGDLLNLIYETNYGVAYLTIGQNVPDDIFEMTPQRIVELVLGDDSIA